MTALDLIKNHFVGKTIAGNDLNPLKDYVGKKIDDVELDNYEAILEFSLDCGDGTFKMVSVSFEWDIELK